MKIQYLKTRYLLLLRARSIANLRRLHRIWKLNFLYSKKAKESLQEKLLSLQALSNNVADKISEMSDGYANNIEQKLKTL